jgi:hypothetical protein
VWEGVGEGGGRGCTDSNGVASDKDSVTSASSASDASLNNGIYNGMKVSVMLYIRTNRTTTEFVSW